MSLLLSLQHLTLCLPLYQTLWTQQSHQFAGRCYACGQPGHRRGSPNCPRTITRMWIGNIKASDGHKISRTQPSLCHPSGNPLTLITYSRRVIYPKKSVDDIVSPNHWKLSLNKSHHRRFLNSRKRHTFPHWSKGKIWTSQEPNYVTKRHPWTETYRTVNMS